MIRTFLTCRVDQKTTQGPRSDNPYKNIRFIPSLPITSYVHTEAINRRGQRNSPAEKKDAQCASASVTQPIPLSDKGEYDLVQKTVTHHIHIVY